MQKLLVEEGVKRVSPPLPPIKFFILHLLASENQTLQCLFVPCFGHTLACKIILKTEAEGLYNNRYDIGSMQLAIGLSNYLFHT